MIRSTHHRQKGLLLLEIVIGLLMLAIILPLLIPNWPEIVGRNVSERTVEETLAIWDASRNYYARNQEWPDEANGCVDAIAVMEAGTYIANIGPNNAWNGAIATSCVPGTSVMEIDQPVTADWQGYILGQLPASSAVAPASINTVIPAPGTSAQTYTQLSRVAVAGSPELNRVETDLDMNGNDIDNAGVVTAEEVTLSSTGVEMSSLGSWEIYNWDTAYNSGSVPYPTCPAGKTPDVNVLPVRICTAATGTLPIERIDFEITDTGSSFRIRPEVFSQNNFYNPTSPECSTFKVQPICN